MKHFVIAVCICLSIAACRNAGPAVTGSTQIKTPSGTEADSGAQIALYHLQDTSANVSTSSDAQGRFHLDKLRPGQYLRVATSLSTPQRAIDFLREFVMHAKLLQGITGYDAISNMPDELKAAIAFSTEAAENATDGSLESAHLLHTDSLAGAFIATWPPRMTMLLPGAGRLATAIAVIDVKDGETLEDAILSGK